MIDITYELDKASLREVEKRLGDISNKAPTVISRALNRTATSGRKELVSGVRTTYTIKAGGAKADMQIKKASAGNLEAIIYSNGSPHAIIHFKHSAPASGAKVGVKKGGLKPINVHGNKAFKGGGKLNGQIYVRLGKEKKPIKKLFSNSMPKMVEMVYTGKSGVGEALKPKIEERLHKEIERQIKYLVG